MEIGARIRSAVPMLDARTWAPRPVGAPGTVTGAGEAGTLRVRFDGAEWDSFLGAVCVEPAGSL